MGEALLVMKFSPQCGDIVPQNSDTTVVTCQDRCRTILTVRSTGASSTPYTPLGIAVPPVDLTGLTCLI